MPEKVYILDEVTVVPGRAREYRTRYLEGYAPGARERGMILEEIWISPPFEWEEGSNTIRFLWSVPGAAGWWNMRFGGGSPNFDASGAEQAKWWRSVEHLTISRKRDVLVSYEDEGASG